MVEYLGTRVPAMVGTYHGTMVGSFGRCNELGVLTMVHVRVPGPMCTREPWYTCTRVLGCAHVDVHVHVCKRGCTVQVCVCVWGEAVYRCPRTYCSTTPRCLHEYVGREGERERERAHVLPYGPHLPRECSAVAQTHRSTCRTALTPLMRVPPPRPSDNVRSL